MRTAFIGQDTFYNRKEDVDRIASSADPNILYYNYDTTKAVYLFLDQSIYVEQLFR